MSTVNLYTPIYNILQKFGCYNEVYTVPEGSTPCPCTNNPYHQYSQVWHLQHPDEPDCHQTGVLVTANEGYFEVQTIWGLAIPNYQASGSQDGHTIAGLTNNWPWLGITQADVSFNRWITPRGTVFLVRSEMPYYLEDSGTALTVALYGLSPITTEVKTP